MIYDQNIIFSVSLLRTPFIGPITWSTNEDEIAIITPRIRRNLKNCSPYLPIKNCREDLSNKK